MSKEVSESFLGLLKPKYTIQYDRFQLAVKICSRNCSIKKWKSEKLHVPDFVGVAYSNRLVLTMPVALPSNNCFNI